MEKNVKWEVVLSLYDFYVYPSLFKIKKSCFFCPILDVTEKFFFLIFLFIEMERDESCQLDRLFVCVLYRILLYIVYFTPHVAL